MRRICERIKKVSSGNVVSVMPEKLEERVALLEAEVAEIKHKIDDNSSLTPWWEKIAGTFTDNPAYDEAMQLGREYRESFRANSIEGADD